MQNIVRSGLATITDGGRNVCLSTATGKLYATTIRSWHNFLARVVFNTGLMLASSGEIVYKILAGDSVKVGSVETDMEEYLTAFEPIAERIERSCKELGRNRTSSTERSRCWNAVLRFSRYMVPLLP